MSLYPVLVRNQMHDYHSEQAMPHSGVDPAFVVPEFLRLLNEAGYTVRPIELP
jgi:hypothetical protein